MLQHSVGVEADRLSLKLEAFGLCIRIRSYTPRSDQLDLWLLQMYEDTKVLGLYVKRRLCKSLTCSCPGG